MGKISVTFLMGGGGGGGRVSEKLHNDDVSRSKYRYVTHPLGGLRKYRKICKRPVKIGGWDYSQSGKHAVNTEIES